MLVEIWPIQEFTYLQPARWNGTLSSERMPYIEQYWAEADPEFLDGEGAESYAMLLDRTRAALDYVFSHGQFIQAVRSLVMDSELTDREKMQKFWRKDSPAIANTEQIELQFEKDGWTYVPADMPQMARPSKSQFDDRGCVGEDTLIVHYGAVHQGHSTPSRLSSVSAVDMPEDVQLRLDPEQGPEQILASLMPPQDVVLVQSSVGGFMGDEHVGVVGDTFPMFADFGSTFDREGPVFPDHRVHRRSPEVHPFQANAGVLEVEGFGQVSAGQLRFTVEEQIVIAGNDQLVPVGKCSQPSVEVLYLFQCPSVEVAGMNQDVAGRKNQLAVKAVGVADADQAKRVLRSERRFYGRNCHDDALLLSSRPNQVVDQSGGQR